MTAAQAMNCPEARLSLGVYVLGAIDPADRSLVDGHLATCRDCRDELAGFAGLPALLARVSPEEAIALAVTDAQPPPGLDEVLKGIGGKASEPPRELLGTLLDLTAARRRRRRGLEAAGGLAAALIVAAGVFVGLRPGASLPPPPAASAPAQANQGPPSGPWQTLTASSRDVSATVSYRAMGWGTQLAAKVSGIPVGISCRLYVVGAGGKKTLAGSWVTDSHEGTVWYPASSGMPSSGVRGFEIAVGTSKTITLTA